MPIANCAKKKTNVTTLLADSAGVSNRAPCFCLSSSSHPSLQTSRHVMAALLNDSHKTPANPFLKQLLHAQTDFSCMCTYLWHWTHRLLYWSYATAVVNLSSSHASQSAWEWFLANIQAFKDLAHISNFFSFSLEWYDKNHSSYSIVIRDRATLEAF